MVLKEQCRAHLRDRLIPFWERMTDVENGGYYGLMDYDLRVDPKAPKGCILNSRILWFFASAYRALGDPALLHVAEHAYAFVDRFWDPELGGMYWSCAYDGQPLDTMKHTYAQSFAIYGLSAYALATGQAEPLQKATALYELIERRMTDELGYCEAFDRAFKPLDNGKLGDNPALMARGLAADKTMNTMLHVMEAYTTLYQAGRDERVRESTRKLLNTIEQKVYNSKAQRLEVFFDRKLNSLLDMQSYGHDIEASWLIDRAADTVCSPEERQRVARWTTALARAVYERAFTGDSLLNERVEGRVDETRIWWVQAETLIGLTNLYQKTGEPKYRDAVEATWTYVMRTFVDQRFGSEWFWSVTPQGAPLPKPIVEPWKCPYHNGRMCMELMARL